MYPDTDDGTQPTTAIPSHHPSRLFPVPRLATIAAVSIVIFLIYAFFSRLTLQFYASVVFSFYALTHSMWVSVVLLGVFQTMLLVPFRIINLLKSAHIKEFSDKVGELAAAGDQYLLKKSVRGGRRVALYYMVNFFVQLTSYVTIGRLFLTDFYSKPLDPWLLYDFVPYPQYPILDRWFKIPFAWFDSTRDLGMRWVWIAWGVIIALQAVLFVWRGLVVPRLKKQATVVDEPGVLKTIRGVGSYFAGSTVLLLVLTFWLMRHFPVEWSWRIFSGDVAYPNPRFNLITALVTFGTVVWINLPKIGKKSDLARAAGIEEKVVRATERELLRSKLLDAGFLGVGAYFITNQIPCAFELSVFTLELISLFSPLTLDRIILRTVKPVAVVQTPVIRDQQKGEHNDALPDKKQGDERGANEENEKHERVEVRGEVKIAGPEVVE